MLLSSQRRKRRRSPTQRRRRSSPHSPNSHGHRTIKIPSPIPPDALYFFPFFPALPSNPARPLFLLAKLLETVLTALLDFVLIPSFLSLTCFARAAMLLFLFATLAVMVAETVSFRSALRTHKHEREIVSTIHGGEREGESREEEEERTKPSRSCS